MSVYSHPMSETMSGGESLWLSIAKGAPEVNQEKFSAAGGDGVSGVRTIAKGWTYVDIEWLVKVKTDSDGNMHYEAEAQPHGERTVLTKSKWLTVKIEWLRVEASRNGRRKRYVLSATTYQSLIDAIK